MKLTSITANRHIFDDRVREKPLRLLLNLEDGRSLRLHVAGDGEQMITDGDPLAEPCDMGEYGRIDIGDVTQSLCPQLRDADIDYIRALNWHGRQVGVKLILAGDEAFHFWVDGDELHWGDEAALTGHNWLDGLVPELGDRLQI